MLSVLVLIGGVEINSACSVMLEPVSIQTEFTTLMPNMTKQQAHERNSILSHVKGPQKAN